MNLNIVGGGHPMYDPAAVQPMRDELTRVGVEELMTPEDVDAAVSAPGTALVVINSVCGCAAGCARPGAMLALQNTKIPDRLTTAFAGMEKEAVQRVREHMAEYPPSSPCIALFKDGKVVSILERQRIEGRSAVDIAQDLAGAFNEHCTREGPSIPREEFEKIIPYQGCGSQIPKFGE